MKTIKEIKVQKRYLDEDQQHKLLNAARRCADPLAQRDYHWMSVLRDTGMRIQEFSQLTVPRVLRALQAGWLVSCKEHCKGKRKANEYLITQGLREHLQALVRLSNEQAATLQQPEGQDQPLVWGRDIAGRAGPLSVRGYQLRVKHWVDAAGLDPRISPHWLRHTRAMNIMRRSRGSNPLKVCQLALNHASLASTGVYQQLSREEFEAELRAVDGRRMPKRQAARLLEGAGA